MSVICQLCWMPIDDPAHAANHAVKVRECAAHLRSTYKRLGQPEPLCQDCGVNTVHNETYWVWPWIWEEAKGDRFLCIGCLEKRLGRKLTRSDFDCIRENAVLINYGPWFPRSKRLKARLRIPDGAEKFIGFAKITIQVDWQADKARLKKTQKRGPHKKPKRRK